MIADIPLCIIATRKISTAQLAVDLIMQWTLNITVFFID